MLSYRKFWAGVRLVAKALTGSTTLGDLEVLDSTNKIYFHDGTINSPLLTEAGTATIENKTIIIADNTIVTAASGNLTATELNAALAELDADTSAAAGDLAAHIADAVGAHAATAISFAPTGTLSSIEVQAALAELDGDIQAHITETVGAHAASAISNTPSGNLAATEVQAALNELQSDIDTRALDSALTAHINDTVGAHAATAISNTPSGNLAATEVQAALNELQSDIDTRSAQITALDEGISLTTAMSSIDFVGATVTATNIGNAVTVTINAGTGDVTGPASSVDGEVALFDGTTGKLLKSATGTGFAKLTAGVLSTSATVNAATEVTGILPLANGGTNKNLTAVNGGILWTDSDSFEVSAAGTTGQYLISAGAASPTWSSVTPGSLQIATITDQKSTGSNGGTSTSATTHTRVLNTLVDTQGIVTSLVANQFVLPAGTYYVEASAPCFIGNAHKIKLRNITAGTTSIVGSSAYAEAAQNAQTRSHLSGEVTIAGATTFALQHYIQTGAASTGLGLGVGGGEVEIFSIVTITKL